MSTFVLVHGGGHGGWCYKPVAQRFGHDVYAPSLSGLADRAHLLSATINLDTHIADIAGLLDFEDFTEAILVGHSYGDTVITGAADRKPERVGHRATANHFASTLTKPSMASGKGCTRSTACESLWRRCPAGPHFSE